MVHLLYRGALFMLKNNVKSCDYDIILLKENLIHND